MAADDLTGNMPTEKMLSYFIKNKIETGIVQAEFEKGMLESSKVFH